MKHAESKYHSIIKNLLRMIEDNTFPYHKVAFHSVACGHYFEMSVNSTCSTKQFWVTFWNTYFVIVKEETYLWKDVDCIFSYKIDGLEFLVS
jgi:hypothetical protein